MMSLVEPFSFELTLLLPLAGPEVRFRAGFLFARDPLSREELAKRLLEIPDAIREADKQLLCLIARQNEREFAFRKLEADLLLDEKGPIDGRNAEVRAAQLFVHTAPERALVMDVKQQVAEAKAELDYQRALHEALIAAAGLMQ